MNMLQITPSPQIFKSGVSPKKKMVFKFVERFLKFVTKNRRYMIDFYFVSVQFHNKDQEHFCVIL